MGTHPLEAKLRLLEAILDLTRQMEQHAGEGLSDAFFALLEERGRLMEKVRELDQAAGDVDIPSEVKEKMLVLLRDIALLNEKVNAQVLSVIAREQEMFVRLREERTLLEHVRASLPAPDRTIDAKG